MKRKNGPVIFKLIKKTVKLSDCSLGPIIHQTLSPALVERIRKIEPVFSEVYSIGRDKWLEGFRRDFDPESEVGVWEAMASAYQTFLANKVLVKPARKEAYRVLICAMGSDVEAILARAKLCYLSRDEAMHLLDLYCDALTRSNQPWLSN
jgi:hypothetical protein